MWQGQDFACQTLSTCGCGPAPICRHLAGKSRQVLTICSRSTGNVSSLTGVAARGVRLAALLSLLGKEEEALTHETEQVYADLPDTAVLVFEAQGATCKP